MSPFVPFVPYLPLFKVETSGSIIKKILTVQKTRKKIYSIFSWCYKTATEVFLTRKLMDAKKSIHFQN